MTYMKEARGFMVGLGLFAGIAAAGNKSDYPVTVDLATRLANGSLGSARNSTDSVQYIYCYTFAYATSAAVTAVCVATSAAGTYGTCTTTDPKLVSIAQSLGGDGLVEFGWDTAGKCSYLAIYAGSYFGPK